ncbi:hypothetical protein ACIOEW_05495 [Streptomyces sp. NPDC087901]|uniref:hypothetical protein n=1 Tax=Streptomyces sp. NPDC087901 TaxID=3365818 RepID=UPI003818A63C
METRDKDTVKADAERASSQILELIDIKGTVTEPGAMTMPCSGYDSAEVYRARHPWSIYKAPFTDMQKAMNRLRVGLPKDGWKIVKDGPDRSQGKSPQIIAESEGRELAIDVRLHKEVKAENSPPMLELTVESRCYRSPATPTASEG